jgi:radical SAM protein (TIGR01212 family)
LNRKKIYNNPGIWSGKAYNFFGDYLFNRYSCRVFKLPINAGLSCPNRDGSTGTTGCVFCSDEGSAAPTTTGFDTIPHQMKNAINTFKRTDQNTRYIAYFQAFSNTYAPVPILKKLYDEALSFPEVMGLMIGTRPDCISRDILKLIKEYDKDNFELWIELGIQSMKNSSLAFLKRGHTAEKSIESINLISEYGISVCVHAILGIPGESWNDMMDTARRISSLPVKGIKIHHMHVIKDTELEHIYNREKFNLIQLKEYVSTVCDFIERLRPDITIHRLMGDRKEDSLLYPRWSIHKGTVLQAIEDEFKKRGTFQGFLYNGEF